MTVMYLTHYITFVGHRSDIYLLSHIVVCQSNTLICYGTDNVHICLHKIELFTIYKK